MKAKIFEIRDEGTFFPMLCVDMNPDNEAARYLMRRVGYPCDGKPNIVVTHASADGGKAWNDPYAWGGRTYPVAHQFIIKNWDRLQDGAVIDVSFILGETSAPKISERVEPSL